MAPDPTSPAPPSSSTAAEPFARPVIENEILTYRAVSPRAVTALLFGVAAVLSFASWYFLPFALLAVLLGLTADRNIERYPDTLTGRGLAQAGVALGLVFGLASLSIAGSSYLVRAREASRFARTYENVLQKGTVEQAVWYGENPARRAEVSPEKLVEELQANEANARASEERTRPVRVLKERLNLPGTEVHFDRVESHGEEGMNIYAAALYDVHYPKAPKGEDREQHALAVFKSLINKKGAREWWVSDFQYPYKPDTFAGPAPAAVDDGHGHAH